MSTLPPSAGPSTEEFTRLRGHLMAVAYRLTGSIADAEDAVQESWLRLTELPEQRRAEIRTPEAWLTTVVGRICLDRLRSAAARREHYIGQWLPEPIVSPLERNLDSSGDPLAAAVRDEDMRLAAVTVLDRLAPPQRVAFILHDAFSVPFNEIAEILNCSVASARQYASRARRTLSESPPAPRAPRAQQHEILQRFMTAVLAGDIKAVAEVLHPDVVLIGDANGKAKTTRQIMVGPDKILRFFQGLLKQYRPDSLANARVVLVNGDLGMYFPAAPGGPGYRDLDDHVQALSIRDGKVVAIYDLANPDKLRLNEL